MAIKAIPDVRRFCQEVGVVRILNRNAGDRDLFQHCIRYYGTPPRHHHRFDVQSRTAYLAAMMNPRLCAGFMIPGEIKCTARVLSPPCCLIMELAPYIPALCPDSS